MRKLSILFTKEINTSINSKSALKRNSYSNHSSQVRKHIKPKTLTSVTTVSNESSEGMPHYSNESNEMIRSDSEINTVISDSSKPNDINNNTIAEESKIESIEEKLQTVSQEIIIIDKMTKTISIFTTDAQ